MSVGPSSGAAVEVPSGTTSQRLAITDSTLTGFSAVIDPRIAADIRRSTITSSGGAGIGIEGGQTSYVSGSVIHINATNGAGTGVIVRGQATTVYLIQDTIDGSTRRTA